MSLKKGPLRVRQGKRLFGPMTHADLTSLVAAGRISPTDEVAVEEGPWMPVGDFLAVPAAEAKVASDGLPPSTRGDPGRLQIVHDGRKYGGLARGQAEELLATGRVVGSDLVSSDGGPWMALADFLAKR